MMKKIIILFSTLICLSNFAYAQDFAGIYKRNKKSEYRYSLVIEPNYKFFYEKSGIIKVGCSGKWHYVENDKIYLANSFDKVDRVLLGGAMKEDGFEVEILSPRKVKIEGVILKRKKKFKY